MFDVSILASLLAVLRTRTDLADRSRNSQRFEMGSRASLRLADTVGAKWEDVTLDNLSLGGARVRAALPLKAKTLVELKLELGRVGEIAVRARVMYARVNGDASRADYGLRFLDLSYQRYRALIDYVNEREGLSRAARRPNTTRRA
jgi:PilZ domain-containing protein